jgi:hypothetical protein
MLNPLDTALNDLEGIKATFDEATGTVTVSGLPYREMRALLTVASLYGSDQKLPVIDPTDEYAVLCAQDLQEYRHTQRDLIDYIDAEIVAAGTGTKSLAAKDSIRHNRSFRKSFPSIAYNLAQEMEPTVLRADPADRPDFEASPMWGEHIVAAMKSALAPLYAKKAG